MSTGLFPAAEAWFNSPIPDYFPGQTQAGFNPMQRQSWEDLHGAAQGTAGLGRGFADVFSSYLGGGPQWNPYTKQVAQNYSNEMNRQFQQRMLPALRGNQVASNMAGSSAAGIETAQAAEDMQRTLSQGLAGLNMGAFQDTQDRFVRTLGQVPQQIGSLTSAVMQPGTIRQSIGAQQQALQQRRLDDEQSRWAYYRDAPQRRLQGYGNLLGIGQPFSEQSGTTDQTAGVQGGNNWLQGVAGGLAMSAPYIKDLFNSGGSGGGGTGYTGNPVGSLLPGRQLGNIWG